MSALLSLLQALENKQITARELTQHAIERAQAQVALNALCTDSFTQANAQAEQIDAHGSAGQRLGGIPMAHKDLFCTQGVRTSCGSKMLREFVPPYSAHIVDTLAQAGAISIGKTNMDEFAMGSSNEFSDFGACINPWSPADDLRVPGGSSGGSAALVAARVLPFATASDTGGSIRQPAAFCGVTGIKPSYGRVSRFGMIAYASSLDQAGVIAESAQDCALVLQHMAGFDARDATCRDLPVPDYSAALNGSLRGLRIGVARFDQSGADAAVIDATRAALAQFEKLGAQLIDVEIPQQQAAIACYYVIAPCEASSNLSRFDGVRYGHRTPDAKSLQEHYEKTRAEGFGAEVKRRILIGCYALSSGYFDAYFLRAQKLRRLIAQGYAQLFQRVDLIATPTAPHLAPAMGAGVKDPIAQYLADVFTVGANLAGLPAMSVPCGFSNALPIGLQLIAPAFEECRLLAAAHQFQLHSDYHRARPPGVEAFAKGLGGQKP